MCSNMLAVLEFRTQKKRWAQTILLLISTYLSISKHRQILVYWDSQKLWLEKKAKDAEILINPHHYSRDYQSCVYTLSIHVQSLTMSTLKFSTATTLQERLSHKPPWNHPDGFVCILHTAASLSGSNSGSDKPVWRQQLVRTKHGTSHVYTFLPPLLTGLGYSVLELTHNSLPTPSRSTQKTFLV